MRSSKPVEIESKGWPAHVTNVTVTLLDQLLPEPGDALWRARDGSVRIGQLNLKDGGQ